MRGFKAVPLVVALLPVAAAAGDNAVGDGHPAADFASVWPLVARYCVDCHTGADAEGEVDLAALDGPESLQKHLRLVQRIAEMVESGQMPPPESDQPTAAERQGLDEWLRAFLSAEARAHAGDPGRVVLRRLNNAEYTWTIRDLTGVASLDPASEFPADGGAGEGFTNTGQSLAMSPSLAAKYLDAAKGIASHAVLLPDGIAFSAGDSRRDFADEWVARVKAFHARFTRTLREADARSQSTVKHGVTLDMGTEGFLPVDEYVAATLALRGMATVDEATIETMARDRDLSPKYLATLWRALSAADSGSPLLDRVRGLWRSATPDGAVAAEIARWQDAVWGFNSVGMIARHFGREEGPASWQEARSPLVATQDFRVRIPPTPSGEASPLVTVHLAAGDAGDGAADDVVVFQAPRLVAEGRADLLLADLRPYAAALAEWRTRLASSSAACLTAAAEALAAGPGMAGEEMVGRLATAHGVEPALLRGWLAVVGLGSEPARLDALLTEKLTNGGGWPFVTGWKGPGDLAVLANSSSDREVQIPQALPPRAIVAHPGADRPVVVGWRSPVDGQVRVEGAVQRTHALCGDGVLVDLEVRRGRSRQSLAEAAAKGADRVPLGPCESVVVRRGDMICLSIAADGDHSCDSTRVDLRIEADGDASGAEPQAWDLAADCAGDILAGNPHGDERGRADVWHFGSEPASVGADLLNPRGSTLGRWLVAAPGDDRDALAGRIAALLAAPADDSAEASTDAAVVRALTAPTGPLLGSILHDVVRAGQMPAGVDPATFGLDPAAFGRHPDGPAAGAIGPADICFRAPCGMTIEIPRELAEGCDLVTTAALPDGAGPEASIQPWVGLGPAPATAFSAAAPVVARDASPAWERFSNGFAAFRDLFPKALCYGRIVPVDDVITLNLFYREDEPLRRLMLDHAETAELDRLWDELLFVAREPLELEDAFEQLLGYASQEATDHPQRFAPMVPVIEGRAEAFRRRLVEVQPRHVDAVVAFAARAFRRPLEDGDERRLRGLYATLREREVPHEEAITALLAHVLVAPEFLYKLETPGPGTAPRSVADHELATRLSYFLWSSSPDAELAAAAGAGRLQDPEVLVSQARRMLAAPASRRLAEVFGTQWLHVHGFASLDEKNGELFPTFAGLRADMEQETILFLDDFFRNDRSILALLDADHTFLNEPLARHYGIEGVVGPEWRRVEGVRRFGRGGILGLATTLSTQAGASRTSPILRGNWLYETILGEKLPKPPRDVPQLADNVPTGLSERQLIALHSEHESCAKCHRRIDPFGFALEEFDAIGRLRMTDASGKPIDARATLLDGTTIDGQQGLRAYLVGPRRDQFVRLFCRKLLGYALGRGVQLSDEPLIDEMVARLAAHDHRVSVAIEAIVTSPQFRSIRGREAPDDAT